MKKWIFVLLMSSFAAVTFAQSAAPATRASANQSNEAALDKKAEDLTAGLAKNLRLSPEQAKKVKAINLFSLQQAEAAKKQFRGEPAKLVAQMDMISQTRMSQLKDVLTPTQFMQYQQRREEKMGVPKEAQNPAAAGQPGGEY